MDGPDDVCVECDLVNNSPLSDGDCNCQRYSALDENGCSCITGFTEFYENDEVIGCYPCSELEGVGADTTCSESPCANNARPGDIIYIKGYLVS